VNNTRARVFVADVSLLYLRRPLWSHVNVATRNDKRPSGSFDKNKSTDFRRVYIKRARSPPLINCRRFRHVPLRTSVVYVETVLIFDERRFTIIDRRARPIAYVFIKLFIQ